MRILKTAAELKKHFEKAHTGGGILGCLADTGFLYAYSYDDDRLHNEASGVFDVLAEFSVPIYSNVISRMEFIDLIFRKQVTLAAVQLYEEFNPQSIHKPLFNVLKNIRDQNTAHLNKNISFKVDERRLKKLRNEFEIAAGHIRWKNFCKEYISKTLISEWSVLEQDLGLNFIEILEGEVSDNFNRPVTWPDMVAIMAEFGLRGPDAMILNLFLKSKFPLLITTDADFETCLADPLLVPPEKTIFIL